MSELEMGSNLTFSLNEYNFSRQGLSVCQHSKSPTMKQAPLHFSRYLVPKKKNHHACTIPRFQFHTPSHTAIKLSISWQYATDCQQVATYDGFTMLQLHHTVHLVILHACWMISTVLWKYKNQHQTHIAHHTFCKNFTSSPLHRISQ